MAQPRLCFSVDFCPVDPALFVWTIFHSPLKELLYEVPYFATYEPFRNVPADRNGFIIAIAPIFTALFFFTVIIGLFASIRTISIGTRTVIKRVSQ
mmetsp:Transcript_37826/g.80795  ORF Transcript_37826/g.80795 Transcript_37826/m.80795 type:complete len:96 (-) Transcript_37826:223-510(-)